MPKTLVGMKEKIESRIKKTVKYMPLNPWKIGASSYVEMLTKNYSTEEEIGNCGIYPLTGEIL